MSNLLLLLIVLPAIAGVVCYFVRSGAVRTFTVTATGAVLTAASLALLGQGSFVFEASGLWESLVTILDFALLFVILYYGFRLRNLLIKVFAAAQIVLLGFFELVLLDHGASVPALMGDSLALVMVLVVSIVGSLICIFGLPYMRKHEQHLKLEKSKQPQFFLYLVLFLGAMNGLVLANNILWLYFFFEVTTFCSFMLIGHDATEVATKNATRALWMNSLGGVALVLGIIWAYTQTGTLSIMAMLAAGPATGVLLVAVGFICLAGFVKAAQLPFQSWLLGAMVAPTPVSALLHSSTMVKAGVYMVLRFSPMFEGSFLSHGIALCGAFTFLACAALAIGQSNGKKILAYSTISNLGLIIACAGLNTPLAIIAAVMLIIFHAISKSLLFLCVGTIEQKIGSRDIEDMRGLFKIMPRTATITIIGILSMLLPPFGVLLCKWMALEAAAGHLFVIVMMALGSALTVVYWARWAGLLMGSRGESRGTEQQPLLTGGPLMLLCASALVFAFTTPYLYTEVLVPAFAAAQVALHGSLLEDAAGGFVMYPLIMLIGLGTLFAVFRALRAKGKESHPYLGGAQVGGMDEGAFLGPMETAVPYSAGNYYLGELFGEHKLTLWINIAAGSLILLMMGGAL
ncbi:NADH-quinone oxidoreductase subunit 5 family protein [Salidesulfovibrio onnuriiensis]|uniref:NADH-quinone oxidoreductase subunit 5 family protein n=1 Tax=Salidesulfovibrio onnuriiensis TaxID=2583823 RepID=UPI0011C8C51A|nr:proton-conducting transporter membrane subunit [Salidesulfovibrio onnuriiensis]